MDMHVINAGKAPERLVSLKADTERGMARERAIAITVAMDHQIAAAPQGLDAGESAPVQTCHDAGPSLSRHQIRMPSHGIRLVGDVEGDHDVLAGSILVP